MLMAETIDRCGLRFLILAAWWVILAGTGAPTAARVLASFAAAMCTVGLTDRLPGRKRAEKAEKKDKAPLAVRLKKFAASALTRRNARRFMTTALILLLFSFVVGVPVWYYVLIAINVALTVACFAAGDRSG